MLTRIPLSKELVTKLVERANETPFDHLDHMQRFWCVPPSQPLAGEVTARVHVIHKSDRDPHLHDHPWDYISIILDGAYYEVRHFGSEEEALCRDSGIPIAGATYCKLTGKWVSIRWHTPGSVIYRKAGDFHRVLLRDGQPATTLFLMGPYRNKWGFATDNGKIYWRDYIAGEQVQRQSVQLAAHYTSERGDEHTSTKTLQGMLADASRSGAIIAYPELSEILDLLRLERL